MERAPYHIPAGTPDHRPGSLSPPQQAKLEKPVLETKKSVVPQPPPLPPIQAPELPADDVVEPASDVIKPVDDVIKPAGDVIIKPADGAVQPTSGDVIKPANDVVTEPAKELKAVQGSPEEERKKKISRRRVQLYVPEKKEPIEELVRRPPMRSRTFHHGPMGGPTGSEMRRKSLSLLKQGHTGERGSLKFRAALRKDSIYEIHPGWETIRKLGRVVG